MPIDDMGAAYDRDLMRSCIYGLAVDVWFGCAGTETHAHDDWRIRFCPMCGRELGVRR